MLLLNMNGHERLLEMNIFKETCLVREGENIFSFL